MILGSPETPPELGVRSRGAALPPSRHARPILCAQARGARGAAAKARLALPRAFLLNKMSPRLPALQQQAGGGGAASVPEPPRALLAPGPPPAPWGRLLPCRARGVGVRAGLPVRGAQAQVPGPLIRGARAPWSQHASLCRSRQLGTRDAPFRNVAPQAATGGDTLSPFEAYPFFLSVFTTPVTLAPFYVYTPQILVDFDQNYFTCSETRLHIKP